MLQQVFSASIIKDWVSDPENEDASLTQISKRYAAIGIGAVVDHNRSPFLKLTGIDALRKGAT